MVENQNRTDIKFCFLEKATGDLVMASPTRMAELTAKPDAYVSLALLKMLEPEDFERQMRNSYMDGHNAGKKEAEEELTAPTPSAPDKDKPKGGNQGGK